MFHALLTDARTALSLSRADVAAAVGVTRFAVRLWENGSSVPPKSRLRDIARVYAIDLDKLTRAWLEAEPTAKPERATEAA